MDHIQITFESEITPAFQITINQQPVEYTINGSNININSNIIFGVNILRIKATNISAGQKIVLTDFELNGVSSRHTLYLAYEHKDSKNVCSTWLTDLHQELTIPFGNPMSWWIGHCGKKIPNSYYGKNLYDFYDIYYPESVEVGNCVPRLMQDFMRYSLGFHVVEKQQTLLHNKDLPWIEINLEYNESALFDEFNRNIDLLRANYYEPKQNQYNKKEKGDKLWHVAMAIHDKTVDEFNENDFPEFFKLINYIKSQNVKILHAFVGTVHPNSYVAPHADDFYKNSSGYETTVGCSQFFIPIGWRQGNYFKFEDVGFLPYEQGAYIVNNSDFMHGSVNLSDIVRFTIGIYCDFTEENLQQFSK